MAAWLKANVSSPTGQKNVAAFGSGMAGLAGLLQGLSTSKNLKVIRKEEAKEIKRRAARILSAARVGYAKSGVVTDFGTPLDVLASGAETAQTDLAMQKYRYSMAQQDAEVRGWAALGAGFGRGATTLLSKGGR